MFHIVEWQWLGDLCENMSGSINDLFCLYNNYNDNINNRDTKNSDQNPSGNWKYLMLDANF